MKERVRKQSLVTEPNLSSHLLQYAPIRPIRPDTMFPWGKKAFPDELMPYVFLITSVASAIVLAAGGAYVSAGTPALDPSTGVVDGRKLVGSMFIAVMLTWVGAACRCAFGCVFGVEGFGGRVRVVRAQRSDTTNTCAARVLPRSLTLLCSALL